MDCIMYFMAQFLQWMELVRKILMFRLLLKRLQDTQVEELILATNPTIEGEATAMYISRLVNLLVLRQQELLMVYL